MYASMEMGDHVMGQDAIVRRSRRLSMYATKSSLKQLTSETQRNVGRKFAKISHRDPLTLLNHLVNRIESYENMIDPIVESFKFLNPLSLDILSYVLVRHVASERSKLKSDGTNVSDWLQALATFSGRLFRRFYTMELKGLLQYIVTRLKESGGNLELCVLSRLIEEMAGIESFQDTTNKALSGGRVLKRT